MQEPREGLPHAQYLSHLQVNEHLLVNLHLLHVGAEQFIHRILLWGGREGW